MENLFIAKTKYTPEIQFLTSGQLSISGLSLLENSYEMYLKSIEWLKEFGKRTPCNINLNLKLEYLDTSSVRSVVDIVKLLNSFKELGFKIRINWYYEKDDDDFYEIGEAMQYISKSEFNLLEKAPEDF
ncbi:MAG: DUF1987 domain-containing protein [Bacteroidota bacterium]